MFYRLTALWALSEGLIGGIIHGLKLPVSGLIAGSISVLCICLIGQLQLGKGTLFKATLLVAIFKFLLSPQAPPTAYIALAFQGFCGSIFYEWIRLRQGAPLFVALLAMVESGLQRLLVFSLLYGQPVWQLFTESIRRLFVLANNIPISEWLIGGYLSLHILAGILTGYFCIRLIQRLPELQKRYGNWFSYPGNDSTVHPSKKNKTNTKWRFTGCFFLLILLFILAEQNGLFGAPWLTLHAVGYLLVRALLMLLIWWLIVMPVAQYLLRGWLGKKKIEQSAAIEQLNSLIPEMRELILQSARFAGRIQGPRNQLREFFGRLLTGLIPVTHE